jgi:integrase
VLSDFRDRLLEEEGRADRLLDLALARLGTKRLDKLTVRQIREWLTKMRGLCQCCAQKKDARRKPEKQRCCAVGNCCAERVSEVTVQDILRALCSALSNAVREELITKNPAALVRVSKPRKSRKVKPWSVEEAQQFLAAALSADDPLYAAFVLILALGLRKGEVLGLDWERVDPETGELYVGQQLQRVSGRLIRRETKTEASDAPLPLPAICTSALKLRKAQQDRDGDLHRGNLRGHQGRAQAAWRRAEPTRSRATRR